jgi:GNAT superfamily N-acetyltransferase
MPAAPEPPGSRPDYTDRLLAATRPRTSRFTQFDTLLNQARPQSIPRYHLAILALRPGQQGQGIGSALLSAHHHALDQAGLAACLEASSDRNRLFYLRHGYTDSGPPIQLPGGPPCTPMIRAPQPKPGSAPPATLGDAHGFLC